MSNPSPLPSSSRILLVDDDRLFLKALSDTLRNEGYTVTTAEGGTAGIDAFRAALEAGEPFALVITDLGMKPVDGRDVSLAIKNAALATPVFLLTGWGEWFGDAGTQPPPVEHIFAKPPKIRELREAMERYLHPE